MQFQQNISDKYVLKQEGSLLLPIFLTAMSLQAKLL